MACRGRRPPTDRTLAEHIVSVCADQYAVAAPSANFITQTHSAETQSAPSSSVQLACLLIKKGSVRLSFIIARLHYLSLSLFLSLFPFCLRVDQGGERAAGGFPLIRTVPIECAVIRTGSAVKNCDHHSSNCFWHFGVWRADSCSNSIWPRIGFLVYTAVHIKTDLH